MTNLGKKYIIVEFCPEKDLLHHQELSPPSWIYMNSVDCPKFCTEREKATEFDSVQKAASVCNQVYNIYDFSPNGFSKLQIVDAEKAKSIEALWNVMHDKGD